VAKDGSKLVVKKLDSKNIVGIPVSAINDKQFKIAKDYLNEAAAAVNSGQKQEALDALEKAIKIKFLPKSVVVNIELAISEVKNEGYKKAHKLISMGIETLNGIQ
jgi:enolase